MRHWGECFFDLIPQGEVCPPPSVYKSNTRKKNTRPIKRTGVANSLIKIGQESLITPIVPAKRDTKGLRRNRTE